MAPKQWKRDDQKRIETALALSAENDPTRFQTAAAQLHQTSLRDVMQYYDDLVHDINLIESGQVPTIDYPDYSGGFSSQTKHMVKQRAKAWTEEEHRKFLEGLAMFGEGYNKSISRHMRTRTPTQVASHAQKYFKRQKMKSSEKKRSSIHDITNSDVNLAADNVTVSESGSNSTMMDQPHLGQEMSLEYHHTPDGIFRP